MAQWTYTEAARPSLLQTRKTTRRSDFQGLPAIDGVRIRINGTKFVRFAENALTQYAAHVLLE